MLELVLIAASTVWLPAHQPTSKPFVSQVPGLTSQLCMERLEDNGAMNGHPSWVDVYNKLDEPNADYSIALSGGQAACVSLSPGRYTIIASSNRFDVPLTPNKKECKSSPYKVNIKPKERITLDVWPALSKSNGGYSGCGWDLLPRGKPQPGNCMVWPNQAGCGDASE